MVETEADNEEAEVQDYMINDLWSILLIQLTRALLIDLAKIEGVRRQDTYTWMVTVIITIDSSLNNR